MLFELHIFVDVRDRAHLADVLERLVTAADVDFVSATGAEVDDEIVDAEDATT